MLLLLLLLFNMVYCSSKRWFVKTETFCKPFPVVKPYLEAHRTWVKTLRDNSECDITSGYRVDAQGKPGGGGLMLLKADDYDTALQIIMKDPLVANECVDWQLNECIWETGGVELI